jgi:hypothetical protein
MNAQMQPQKPERDNTIIIQGVALHGADLVSPKMINVFEEILKLYPENKLYSIIISEDDVKDADGDATFGGYYKQTGTIVIDLTHHFEDAANRVWEEKDKCNMSLRCYLWINLLQTFLHELAHCIHAGEGIDPESEESENKAKEAQEKVYELAKTIDIEVPNPEDEPFLGPMVLEFERDLHEVDTEDWAQKQLLMLEEDLVMVDLDVDPPMKIRTIHQLCREAVGDNDAAWSIKPQELTVFFSNEPVKENAPLTLNEAGLEQIREESLPRIKGTGTVNDIVEGEPPLTTDFTGGADDLYFTDTEPTEPAATDNVPPPIESTAAQVLKQTLISEQAKIPGIDNLERHNLTADQMIHASYLVFIKIFIHIFTECGYIASQEMVNDTRLFRNIDAVFDKHIYIGDIPGAKELFVAMETCDANGRKCTVNIWEPAPGENRQPGYIKGGLTWKEKLPIYSLFLNINGKTEKRTLLPANCNKRDDNGLLTTWARESRAGKWIAMVYKNREITTSIIHLGQVHGAEPEYKIRPFSKDSNAPAIVIPFSVYRTYMAG